MPASRPRDQGDPGPGRRLSRLLLIRDPQARARAAPEPGRCRPLEPRSELGLRPAASDEARKARRVAGCEWSATHRLRVVGLVAKANRGKSRVWGAARRKP